MNDYNLNTNWKLWFHSINETNWNIESYKQILEINNLYDLNILIQTIESNHLQNAMFFIMRNGILPMWEYPDNREGYSLSFKVPASDLKQNWDKILIKILTEEILNDKTKYSEINGLSISPKREFNIIKIWLKNDINSEFIKEYPPYFVKDKSIYKKNMS